MTKDAFVSIYQDELVGLLLAAFSMDDRARGMADTNMVHQGRFLRDTMIRAKKLLDRIFTDLDASKENEASKAPVPG